jgi:hypothetical protein
VVRLARFTLEAENGTALPTDVRGADATGLVLDAGRRVEVDLRWTAVPSADEPQSGACGPDPARFTLDLGGTHHPVTGEWHFGPVCDHGRLELGRPRRTPA